MSKQEHIETTEESILPPRSKLTNQTLNSNRKRPPSMVLWRESPSSLTRDRAPAHRIPKAERFCNTRLDLLKYEQLESMQLERRQPTGIAVTIPRSTRPEHFAKHAATPSPASYFNKFLERGCRSERSLSSTPSRADSHAATMNRFFNYHKSYMPQAKHLPYQPECTIDNPSPAHYKPNSTLHSKNIKHSFKHPLKRFKEAPK